MDIKLLKSFIDIQIAISHKFKGLGQYIITSHIDAETVYENKISLKTKN